MRDPSHRYRAVQKALTARNVPDGILEEELYKHLKDKTGAQCTAGDALEIYQEEEHRAVLEAFLLAGAGPELIEKVLSVPTAVTAAYKHLFFDQSVFKNRLETLGYAADFEGSTHAREVLKAALTVGMDYLLWVYGRAEVQVDARDVIRHTMAEAYYRGMAHRGNSITSGVSKEAHRWWATAVRNAELLEKIDPRAERQAFEEIRIQLEKYDDTYSPESAPVDPSEIMH